MPQKKPVKKASKPAVKKIAPAKKAAPKKAAKKSVPVKAKKPAPKPAKPVAKSNNKTAPAKKAVAKHVVKAEKPAKHPAVQVKKQVVTKQPPKPVVKIQEKHVEPMAKTKKIEEKVSSAPKKAAKPEPVKEVKVPKISVKTSVPYEPSYKSLEQRQQVVKPAEPLVRYSDSELNEFKELILRKLESSKKELAYLQGLITRKDDMGGDESENRYMTMEDGSISMEREQLSQMASRQITYIDHLEKALIRIENKTYGICRVTGRLIDKARLRAVPHATLSLEAKLGLVKAGE